MSGDQMKPEEARLALDSVAKTEHAALRAAMAPRWLILFLAALLAGMLAAQQDALAVIFLLTIVAVIAARKRGRTVVRRRAKLSDHPWAAVAGVAIGALFIALSFWTDALADRGVVWPSAAFGASAGLALIGLHEWGRARMRAMERRDAS